MTPKRKKILFSVVILLLSAICYLGYDWYCFNRMFSLTVPRKPKNTLKEIHQIDWWENSQENLIIDSFKVKWLDGKMNLFNNSVLVAISIYGRLSTEGKNKFFVDKFHVSERPLYKDSIQKFDVEIQITPIIKQKKEEVKDLKGNIEFAVVHERIIKSIHFGENKFLFRCGKLADSFKVFQSK